MTSVDVVFAVVVLVVFCVAVGQCWREAKGWHEQREFEQTQEESYDDRYLWS